MKDYISVFIHFLCLVISEFGARDNLSALRLLFFSLSFFYSLFCINFLLNLFAVCGLNELEIECIDEEINVS